MSRGKGILFMAAGVAATGGLLFGFDTGVISGAILQIVREFHFSPVQEEVVIGAVLAGCILGAASGGLLADRFGRKAVIMGTALVFGLGTLMCVAAGSMHMLIVGRLVVGLGIGTASFAVPLYLSEISPPDKRGALVSLNQLMITIGIVVSYCVDGIFSGQAHGWRWMFLAGLFPALVLGTGMLFLPCSPRWLAARGHANKAKDALKRLGQESSLVHEDEAEQNTGSLRELMSPRLRPVMLVGIGIMFVQQFTGINTVIYYAPTIFKKAGFASDAAAIWATVGVGMVNVLMTIAAVRLLDRIGRKPLLSAGLFFMTLALLSLAGAFRFQHLLAGSMKWVAVGALVVYIAAFAVSLGPIGWLLISEIYPLNVRGTAMSIATLSNWGFNCIVAMTFLSLVEAVQPWGAFALYAGIGAAGWFFCRFFVPETKGISLENIEADLWAGRPVVKLGTTSG
ncbi:sugar porter family MFS transporter [Pseudodesulfovibrio senegalensis]|nr:sugar porter family MFS transporter [Pseudodesulfovibrio senegalensis]